MTMPAWVQDFLLEQHEQVARQYPDPESDGIGRETPAGHALHAEADLEFLDFSEASPLWQYHSIVASADSPGCLPSPQA